MKSAPLTSHPSARLVRYKRRLESSDDMVLARHVKDERF